MDQPNGLTALGLFDLIRKGFKRFLDISFVCMDWIVLVLIVIYGECFFEYGIASPFLSSLCFEFF